MNGVMALEMRSILTLVAAIFTLLACAMLMISAIGLLRLKGALARQHAVTKAATLSLSLGIVGLMLYVIQAGWVDDLGYGSGWLLKLWLLWVVLLMTLPLASHALARSSLSESKLQQLNAHQQPAKLANDKDAKGLADSSIEQGNKR